MDYSGFSTYKQSRPDHPSRALCGRVVTHATKGDVESNSSRWTYGQILYAK